ncbi:MAG: hypothetical protein V4591_05465 [Bdellovibrionota bacterium]
MTNLNSSSVTLSVTAHILEKIVKKLTTVSHKTEGTEYNQFHGETKSMDSLFKFLFVFIVYGVVWFFVFSIPINKNENIFLVVQKVLSLSSVQEKKEKTKNEIHKEQVIDALTNAFKP